ncbi:MAG: hypothetical protein ABR549_18900 [Mycobacteriales bacterium]
MGRPSIVLAHTFGERYELPIPLYLFVISGVTVVLLSFLLVLRRDTAVPAAVEADDVIPATDLNPVAALVSVVLLLAIAAVGLTGTQEVSDNLAPMVFWILLWIAVPLSCGLLGDWTRPVNPFANLARLGNDAGLRKLVLARRSPLEWPRSFGWWPALSLFVLLVLGELVFNNDTVKPSFVGVLLLVYGAMSFFLGLLFGPAWLERGEVFSALWNAWGRLGWWRFGAPGRPGFAGGLEVPFDRSPSRVVFVLLLLISINFDGLLATPQWDDFERRTYGGNVDAIDLLRTLSLVALVLLVLGVFLAFAFASARAGGHRDGPFTTLAGLLPSLVPIAYGYLIAHNLQYLMIQLQQLYPLLKNPGYGNTDTGFVPNTNVLPARVNWYVSLLIIVAVHVIAVVLSHRHLRRPAPEASDTRRSEYPWLVAMVAYTAFSLVLIALPLTQSAA